jgi:hypothetical protein
VKRLKQLSVAARRLAGPRVQRWAAAAEALPIGRRYELWRGELGLMQRWYAAQPTQRIVVAVLERREPLARESLEVAVRALCQRHPNALGICEERSRKRLSVRPLRADDPLPWFDPSAQEPRYADAGPGARLPPSDRDPWMLATAMVHAPFGNGAPLFRFALASDGRHVVTAFDHLIADGVSAGIYAAELGALLAGDPLLPASTDDALPLDARLDLRPSPGVLVRAFRGTPDTRVLLAPRDAPTLTSLRTAIVPEKLSRDLVEALVVQARRHAVSLHAVLSAAALSASLEALAFTRGTLRLTTPISLRERCRPVPNGIGVFIASIDTELAASMTDDPWMLARHCRDDIARKRPEAHRTVGLLQFAGDLTSLATKYERTANGRTATVEVSNVGRVIGVPHGAAVWLTQGAHYHAALFVLTVATSDSDGALRCCLSYPQPLIDAARASRFMRAFEATLHAMRVSSEGAFVPPEA